MSIEHLIPRAPVTLPPEITQALQNLHLLMDTESGRLMPTIEAIVRAAYASGRCDGGRAVSDEVEATLELSRAIADQSNWGKSL